MGYQFKNLHEYPYPDGDFYQSEIELMKCLLVDCNVGHDGAIAIYSEAEGKDARCVLLTNLDSGSDEVYGRPKASATKYVTDTIKQYTGKSMDAGLYGDKMDDASCFILKTKYGRIYLCMYQYNATSGRSCDNYMILALCLDNMYHHEWIDAKRLISQTEWDFLALDNGIDNSDNFDIYQLCRYRDYRRQRIVKKYRNLIKSGDEGFPSLNQLLKNCKDNTAREMFFV